MGVSIVCQVVEGLDCFRDLVDTCEFVDLVSDLGNRLGGEWRFLPREEGNRQVIGWREGGNIGECKKTKPVSF